MFFFISLVLVLVGSGVLVSVAQPISLGVSLVVCSLGVAGLVGSLSSSWLGFLLMVVYVGGMLVMFSYVCCLASNVVFGQVSNVVGLFVIVEVIFFGGICVFLSSNGVLSVCDGLLKNYEIFDLGRVMLSYDYGLMMVVMAFLLFMVMVCVVKLCILDQGTLRPF